MTTYDVTVTREDDLWVSVVHGLPANVAGAIDGEHLAELLADVPEIVAGLTDTDPEAFDIRFRFEVHGHDVTDSLGRFLQIQHDLSDRIVQRNEARAQAIRDLTEAGLSRRATGDAVGLSGGRIQQLVS
ncbi:MAG: MerR [Pseudonocardia sp.]